jgi:hypothetical protein
MNSESEECKITNDLCVIIENHDRMVDQFLFNMKYFYDIKIWPKGKYMDFNIFKKLKDSENYHFRYKNAIKNKIKSSEIIAVMVTNKLCKSSECIEWIDYSRKHNKELIAIIIEEIEDYNEIKEKILHHFIMYSEIYKARVNLVGFDYYLWASDYFENFKCKIEELLDTDIVSI